MRYKSVVDRFIAYAKIDTQSDELSNTCPSTNKQFTLAKIIVEDLKDIGMADVKLDENCYITATLPSNSKKDIPVIGFISHMDTSPDMPGENVKPQIIENYQGEDITLNRKEEIMLSPADFPELHNYIGQTLITTDGTTLLGADDKAGIAEIINAMEYLIQHPEIEHGKIKVGFTPDEEIGRGADKFNVKNFGARFAYTMDGGPIGELEYETFNAALAEIKIKGRNVHPGYAKNKMINSMHLAMEFHGMLPKEQRPEHTEKYEGFYHLIDMDGNVEESKLRYIIRDHNRVIFNEKKLFIHQIADFLNKKHKHKRIFVDIKDQYYNMREKIEDVFEIVDLARVSMEEVGIKPLIKPVRGGTDGARLSFEGLPTPNIFAGGQNFHGKYEYISVQSMEKAVEVIVQICKNTVKKFG